MSPLSAHLDKTALRPSIPAYCLFLEKYLLEKWFVYQLPYLLWDLGQVTSHLWASVSSSNHWRRSHYLLQVCCKNSMQMNTTDLEECLPHNKRSESVFSHHHHPCYDIYYKGQWLSYLPIRPGTWYSVWHDKHSRIIESMDEWTFKLILPKLLHFSEKFKFKFKEQISTLVTILRNKWLTVRFQESLGKGFRANGCFMSTQTVNCSKYSYPWSVAHSYFPYGGISLRTLKQ